MATSVAVAVRAVLKAAITSPVTAVLVVQHAAAMIVVETTVVVSAAALVAVLLVVVLPRPVVAMVMPLAKTVASLRAVMVRAMAASLALVTMPSVVVALPPEATWVPPVVVTVVTSLHASPLSPSLLVASRLRPTMHASVLHAQRVDFL